MFLNKSFHFGRLNPTFVHFSDSTTFIDDLKHVHYMRTELEGDCFDGQWKADCDSFRINSITYAFEYQVDSVWLHNDSLSFHIYYTEEKPLKCE